MYGEFPATHVPINRFIDKHKQHRVYCEQSLPNDSTGFYFGKQNDGNEWESGILLLQTISQKEEEGSTYMTVV